MVVIAGLLFAGALAAIAGKLVREFDWGIRRAERRAREGDLDGAIADLREQTMPQASGQSAQQWFGVSRNYKCCRSTRFALNKSVSALAGRNGVGKTTLLNCIEWVCRNCRMGLAESFEQ